MMMSRTVMMSLVAGLAVSTSPLSHLTVRIDDQIPQSECHSTLNNLDSLISETSAELRNISINMSIRRVMVVLPAAWHNATCVLGLPRASLASIPQEADILVKDSLDTDIRTLQYGGCGVRSRRVILPRSRLLIPRLQNNETRASSTDLLHSLLKHEFGYFDTRTGRGDGPLFPELYKVGEEAELENCNRDPLSDADYKKEAPTKQNLMCQEQSPMSVITSSLQKRISEEERPGMVPDGRGPRYEYVIRHSERHLLVLDRSQESKQVWKHLHNALHRLISSLPVGDEVSVITFGRQAEVRLTPTTITETNRDGVYSRIPGKIGQASRGCLTCALREAALMTSDAPGVRTRVIVATSSPVEDMASLRQSLETLSKKAEVRMLMMSGQLMLDDVEAEVYHVTREEQRSVSDLSDILTLTLGDQLSARSHDHVKFFSEEFQVAAKEQVMGKFVVENNLRENMLVMTSSLMQEDIELFQLTSPRGTQYNFPVLDKGAASFQFNARSEAGVWSYKVKLTPFTITPRVPVHVTAYASVSEAEDIVEVEAWTEVDLSRDYGEAPEPVLIFARVTEAERPVVEAEVIARVVTPDGDSVDLLLRDLGAGHPDLEAGDGIYSAAFTQFSQVAGFYSVKIMARNHEGRASVASTRETGECGERETLQIPSLHFTRYLRVPSFFLSRGVRFSIQDGVPVRKDVYPPARITDLQVSGMSDLMLELSWTASGDDFDFGSAAKYDLRWSEERNVLLKTFFNQGNVLEDTELPVPSEFGSLETVNVTVPKVNTLLYVAVVAVDSDGNTSPVSNILPVFLRQRPVTESSLLSDPLTSVSSLTLPEVSSTAWVYILSISLATVSLIVIMLLVIVIRRRRMRKLQESCPIPYFIELGPPAAGDKADRQLVQDNSRDFPDDTLSYPSSPARAVATHPVLDLYEHHARQYQMYQNMMGQPGQEPGSESSGRSSSSSQSETDRSSSDKQSEQESPPWRRQYRGHHGHRDQASDSQISSGSSHLRHSSRRRRESFV